MASKQAYFGPGLLSFLEALSRNNRRDWFEKNKARYEAEVREPALAFVRALEPRLEKISPYLVASDRKVGGSLMRIHRDVRFSKDKSPYKTNVGIQFRHESGKDVHAPCYYVHVEPGDCFLAAGMWHPATDALRAVRDAIVADPAGWVKVRDGAAFRREWALDGGMLTRAPRGYDPEHPLLEDLKRKDHVGVAPLEEDLLTSPTLVGTVAKRFRAARGYLACTESGPKFTVSPFVLPRRTQAPSFAAGTAARTEPGRRADAPRSGRTRVFLTRRDAADA